MLCMSFKTAETWIFVYKKYFFHEICISCSFLSCTYMLDYTEKDLDRVFFSFYEPRLTHICAASLDLKQNEYEAI